MLPQRSVVADCTVNEPTSASGVQAAALCVLAQKSPLVEQDEMIHFDHPAMNLNATPLMQ